MHPGFNIPQIAKSICSTILEFIAIGCEPLDSTYDLLYPIPCSDSLYLKLKSILEIFSSMHTGGFNIQRPVCIQQGGTICLQN